jgi:hypothetical protein
MSNVFEAHMDPAKADAIGSTREILEVAKEMAEQAWRTK